jgi:hypothetical protein
MRPVVNAAAILVIAASIAAAAAAVAKAGVPAGATAVCVDGSYSFSQRHSGSCSHHGVVARWLDSSSSPTTRTTSRAAGGLATGEIQTGTSILLGPRTKTSHCRLGADPDRACSPGAYYDELTKAVICSSSFHTSSIRNVPESLKHAVESEYGLAPGRYGRTLEIDHIVSLELGGSNDIANLYPEEADARPGYRVKDGLENRLHALVCTGAMTLRAAQRGIASNWQALYTRVYGATPVG